MFVSKQSVVSAAPVSPLLQQPETISTRPVSVQTPSVSMNVPNGVCFSKDGFLYIVEHNRLLVFPAAEFFFEGPDPAVAVVVPQGELVPVEEESFNHTARVCDVGPDGKLYISLGQPHNVQPAEKVELYDKIGIGGIIRINTDGTGREVFTLDGNPVEDAEPPRLWLYHKPTGLVTTERDEKGRRTVFDALPGDLPRVMSVGRLDLNSEGLLLLTNDGEIKRRLELPSTGWLRKYRVRVNGTPDDATLQPLRDGLTVEGERFQPMQVTLDRQQGRNAWATVAIREGRNREVRRAMDAVGLKVNRLIRISYGPFRLGELKPGEVEEVKARVLRDQLGLEKPPEDTRVTRRRKRR